MENNNQSPSKTVERLESNAHYTSEALQTLTAQNSNYRFTVGISPAKDGNINVTIHTPMKGSELRSLLHRMQQMPLEILLP